MPRSATRPSVEHHDLVHLVQALQVVGDQQGGPPGRGGQQVGGQRAAVLRVQVRGRLVQDEHGRVGQQGPGQGEPLPLAAGQRARRARRPGCPSPPAATRSSRAAGPGRGRGQLGVGGAGRAEPQVVPDRRVEEVRVLRRSRRSPPGRRRGRQPARSRPLSGPSRAQVDEPEQHRGHGGLARAGRRRPGRPGVRAPGPGLPRRRERPAAGTRPLPPGARSCPAAAPGGGERAGRAGGTGSGASSTAAIRRPRSWTGRAGARPRAAAVTASNAASAVRVITASGTRPRLPGPGGGDPEQQHAPQGQPRDRRGQPGAQAGRRGRAAGEPGELGVRGPDPVQAGLDRAERVQLGRAVQQVGDRGAQFAAGGRGAPGGAAGRRGDGQRHQHPGGQQARGEHPGRGRQDQQHRGGRAGPDQRRGQRRRDAADEQVLGGVHVADQPGEQVAGPEGGQPGRGQPLQPAVDGHPDVGEDPEGHVVGEQPLQVAQHTAADAERRGPRPPRPRWPRCSGAARRGPAGSRRSPAGPRRPRTRPRPPARRAAARGASAATRTRAAAAGRSGRRGRRASRPGPADRRPAARSRSRRHRRPDRQPAAAGWSPAVVEGEQPAAVGPRDRGRPGSRCGRPPARPARRRAGPR